MFYTVKKQVDKNIPKSKSWYSDTNIFCTVKKYVDKKQKYIGILIQILYYCKNF